MKSQEIEVKFPNYKDPDCTHTIGVFKSGRCKSCGFKLLKSLTSRAFELGLLYLVIEDSNNTNYPF